MNVHKQRMRADFVRSAVQNAYGAFAPASPQPALRRQGKIRDLCTGKIPQARHPLRALCAQRAALIRAKAFAKDKGSIGSEGVLRRPSDLMSTFGRKLGKFQENNAERTKVREHCCLASFRRRTGCSPPLWRSRRHERQNSMEFCRAMSQPARISGALRFYFSVPSGSLVMGST